MYKHSKDILMKEINVNEAIAQLKKAMVEDGIDPRNGLPESLFRFVSSISPIPNIDLFIVDDKNRFLLSWRDDEFYGKGWHLPGGCIRLLEPFDVRIQKTAKQELGTHIIYNPKPILTVESLAVKERIKKQGNLERVHNISVLYMGQFPSGYDIEFFNSKIKPMGRGYLRWFGFFPEDFLDCQRPMYEKFLSEWCEHKIF